MEDKPKKDSSFHLKRDEETQRFVPINPMELHEHRILVLMEQDDGKFHQVGLTAEQFKKVSRDICTEIVPDESLREGFEMAHMNINPDWNINADHFIGLKSFYADLEE